MRIDSILLRAAFTICALLYVTPLSAQQCLGLPGERGSATLGFEGRDGAAGGTARVEFLFGRTGIGLERASLGTSVRDGTRSRTGFRLTRQLVDGPVGLCGVGGANWTSYQAVDWTYMWVSGGDRFQESSSLGDYDRVRVPFGLAAGRAFRAEQRFSINPFVTFLVVHDSERMGWVTDGLETRSHTGLGGSLGFTAKLDKLFLRTQLENAWTAGRELSGRTNSPAIRFHIGWAF